MYVCEYLLKFNSFKRSMCARNVDCFKCSTFSMSNPREVLGTMGLMVKFCACSIMAMSHIRGPSRATPSTVQRLHSSVCVWGEGVKVYNTCV